jgi:Family of unknown function (DUF5906)/RepB DNA-primase from phage plasmid
MTGAELDLAAIREHVTILHRLAAPLAGKGKLIVAAYGENPNLPDPKTGELGRELRPEIRHFKIGDVEDMVKTIVTLAREPHRNVYIPTAVLRPDLPKGKKGGETDVVGTLALVVDFDDENASRWSERLPKPPCYVLETSKGRFQPFYLLSKPEPLNVVKPVATRLKAFAGCDHGTVDLSHVWRIPGTPNWPNAKKLASGRPYEPQQARVAQPCTGEPVDISELAALLPEEPQAKPNGYDRRLNNSHHHQSSNDLEAILARLPQWIIDRLKDPNAADRSKALFSVINGSIRLDLADATIESIIRAYPGGSGSKYAGRSDLAAEIGRIRTKTAPGRRLRGKPAKYDEEISEADLNTERDGTEKAVEQKIAEFNARYAVVNEAGKCWIFEWRNDPVLKRKVLDRISHADFRRLYENQRTDIVIDGRIVSKSLADLWLAHPARHQYLGGVIFDPTSEAPTGYLNLWRGFAAEPKPGDWSLLREHIERVICCNTPDWAEYLFNWLARLFQYPNIAGEVAIALRGAKGSGKGILGRWIVKAFGQHGMQIFHSTQLVGRFNEHLRDCVVLFADEAFYAGDKQHEGALKGLVTEPFLAIEGKYQRVVIVPNMLHVILASNNDWVIPASSDERRYCVFDVADNRCGDLAYFAAIERQMQNGGLAAMLYDLLHCDISKFEVRSVPQTEALKIQKTLSLPSLEQWWLDVLSRGFLWKSRHGAPYFRDWQTFYSTELLHRSYMQWCQENRIGSYRCKTREGLGRFMAKLYQDGRPAKTPVYELNSFDTEQGIKTLDQASIVWQERAPGYNVSELNQARDRFIAICDVHAEWRRTS